MTQETDFGKLLLDAPMAPDADTVTLVGALERNADAKQFGLRLPDGRSIILDVDAVKSAKRIGGAIGQLLVNWNSTPSVFLRDCEMPPILPKLLQRTST